ncbi:MAG: hypothetical protein ACRD0L_03450 [Acidimicrobiales bacterium]
MGDDARGRSEVLISGLHGLPAATAERVGRVSGLDEDEAELLCQATAVLAEPLGAVARRLLEDWAELDLAERTAGLLFLAEALAVASARS